MTDNSNTLAQTTGTSIKGFAFKDNYYLTGNSPFWTGSQQQYYQFSSDPVNSVRVEETREYPGVIIYYNDREVLRVAIINGRFNIMPGADPHASATALLELIKTAANKQSARDPEEILEIAAENFLFEGTPQEEDVLTFVKDLGINVAPR